MFIVSAELAQSMPIVSSMIITFGLLALIEESAKHIGSIGLLSHEFRFSQREIIVFTFFTVLGFVFIENLIYLFRSDLSMSEWIFRSFFTLIAHVFFATIVSYAWWKALAYDLYSLRYIGVLIMGIVIATSLHIIYNIALREGYIMIICLYAIVGYIFFTRLLLPPSLRNPRS
jgi:PrsW family intramembrane metalloprotease